LTDDGVVDAAGCRRDGALDGKRAADGCVVEKLFYGVSIRRSSKAGTQLQRQLKKKSARVCCERRRRRRSEEKKKLLAMNNASQRGLN
jgi:hypothetical protein